MHSIYRHLTCLCSVVCALFFAGCTTGASRLSNLTPFEPVPGKYTHTWDKKTHPFTGAAVIDADGDGRYEIFVGGGEGQEDFLFSYQGGGLQNLISKTGLSSQAATYGVRAIDMDSDGDTDLVVARDDGVYLYLNRGAHSMAFQKKKVPVSLPERAVPFDVAVGDIDRDGDADLYISTFVAFSAFKSATFNDPDHAKTNRLLANNGDLTFTDITDISGTQGKNNTFCAAFVDLNTDGWQDLVVAQNTGEIEIFRNLKGGTFQEVPTRSGYGFWMGLGVGDIDNDGDQDLFFPNVGTSIPEFLTRGDILESQRHTHDWLLMRNDGNFSFSDVTNEWIPQGEGFAWGGVFEDVNLDGYLDLFVAQNYIKWPPHKVIRLAGRAYIQNPKSAIPRYEPAPQLGLSNPYFGQSSIVVDLNQDGRQDFIWLNMDGPIRAFLNRSRERFITIVLPDDLKTLGARVYLETDKGRSYTRQVISGQGYMTDQTPDLTFGLGPHTQALKLVVIFPDGTSKTLHNPPVNTRLTLP